MNSMSIHAVTSVKRGIPTGDETFSDETLNVTSSDVYGSPPRRKTAGEFFAEFAAALLDDLRNAEIGHVAPVA